MTRLLCIILCIASLCAVTQGSVSAVANGDATFQVALYYSPNNANFVQRCTGAMVSDMWVVTTASCLCAGNRSTCNDGLAQWNIHFGATNVTSAFILGVSRIEIHPLWDGVIAHGFDAALFRLNGSVNIFRADMNAVFLPESVEFSCEDRQVGVYSWGTTASGLLNQLVVTPAIVSADFAIFATRFIINNIRESVDTLIAFAECTLNPNCFPQGIAVQYSDPKIGFCSADIGAPLIWTTSSNQHVLLGLASYRFSGNGIMQSPGQSCIDVYVNGSSRVPVVFQQIDVVQAWIRTTITNATVFRSVCGDGLIGFVEECDDGNVISGDGCSMNCLLESDFACFPARANWIHGDDNDDHDSHTPWHINRIPVTQVDFCGRSICHRMHHDDDDDGSSGCGLALAIVLPIVGGLICLALIIFCCLRRRKRNRVTEPVPVVEPVMAAPVAPVITTPASPIMDAPPPTPLVLSPVQVAMPVYGMATSGEVMPPIVQRENIMQAPMIESTTEIAAPTYLK